MRFYAPHAVYDMSRVGLGTFEGRAAIHRFLKTDPDQARAAAERLAAPRR